jgi:hypothetical protein
MNEYRTYKIILKPSGERMLCQTSNVREWLETYNKAGQRDLLNNRIITCRLGSKDKYVDIEYNFLEIN